MLHNVLIAVDGSQNSLRAVEYAGRVFAPNPEARLVLFHILPAISRINLDKKEIKAILLRKELLLKEIEEMIQEVGEDKFLY